ncbi:splicing regulatory glutamine/lysine-rich protein 1-like [Papaver somniferum]|uniref:splicing regulatory glutamine/lysine-rich protein 1-like n=1 Tax=Papaver somniferum TaxID=3469 RepID=UPI000E6FCF57|nr:splicing regulatory glutamine/lysine-rich protein 1-like [Papaver somniferum]
MARRTSAGENATPIRRSRRIAGRRRGEIAETSRMGERNKRPQPIRFQIQQEPRENDQRNLDEVSVHTTDTDTAEENEEGTQQERAVGENEDNMTIGELRQQLADERRREEELRANLTRQNDELRVENQRLKEKRSQSRSRTTRAGSRSSRSTTRRSRSEHGDNIQGQFMDNSLDDNFQVNENSQDERERNRIEDRYIQVGEDELRRRHRREGRLERNGEYNRMHDEEKSERTKQNMQG